MIHTDVSYLLYWDDDAIPITGNMTLGNHLDNDIIVGGEDVNDFHARIDLTERGPVVIPLGDSTISVNGQERSKPLQVIIGDVLGVGQATMQIGVEVESRGVDAENWTLHPDQGDNVYPIHGELIIGRAETADINIPKEHISRHHARFVEHDHFVWIQDLNSANGTRINNTLLHGGARLFHGDYVSFDKERYQLIGKGGDLTPVESFVDPLRGTTSRPPPKQVDTTEFSAVEEPVNTTTTQLRLSETGAFLIGSSESVDGKVFRIGLGESLIGRGSHCNIIISDSTVSHEHAQIKVRPEGVTVTNLMSTNGSKVNGVEITSAKLEDGDVLRLGRVSLVFKDIPLPRIESYPWYRRASFLMAGGAAVFGLILLAMWVL